MEGAIPTREDDLGLIRRVLEREPEAEEHFVERYGRFVIALARGRFGLDKLEAEELLQVVVARLWDREAQALRAWRGEGRFTTYLAVIVTNLILKRRKKQPHAESGLEQVAELEAQGSSPESASQANEQARVLRRAVAVMPPRDRLLLRLRYGDGRSPAQIATFLGLRPGTARKALHDAVSRLRRRLRMDHPEFFPGER